MTTLYITLYIVTGGEEYCTQWELRKKYALGQGHTSALARGDRKSYKGWRLFNDPEDSAD